MTAQDERSALKVDPRTGNILLRNLSGNTIVFDSFSSEDEVQARAETGDIGFNVHVSGSVAATLSPSKAHVVKAQTLPKAQQIEDTQTMIDALHAEVARHNQTCAELLRSLSPVAPPTTKDTTPFSYPVQAEATPIDAEIMPLYPTPCYPSAASKRPKITFAQTLMYNQLPPASSSAFLPRRERIAVSALQKLERSSQE